MRKLKSNTPEGAVEALEIALKLLEKKSLQKADAGASLWLGPKGKRICVRLTQEDCERIPGMIFLGGTCKDALHNGLGAKHD